MNRISLILICITIVCGLLIGLTGAFLYRQVSESPQDVSPVTQDNAPMPQANISETTPQLLPKVQHTPILPEPATLPQIVVEVTGAVRRPGVYSFAEGTRVNDGIREAGGTTRDAAMDDINIAAKLMDNTSLFIPYQLFRHQSEQTFVARRTATAAQSNPPRYTRSGWANGTPPGGSSQTQQAETPVSLSKTDAPVASNSSSGLIDINTASLDALQTLPGIGPKTAAKIDAYRKTQPFQSVGDLEAVNGIGPKTMDAVRDMITVK